MSPKWDPALYQQNKIAWHEVVLAFGRACGYCGERSAVITRDHIFPKAECGPDEIWNYVPACPPCNRGRGSIPIREWLRLRPKAAEMTLDRIARAEAVWSRFTGTEPTPRALAAVPEMPTDPPPLTKASQKAVRAIAYVARRDDEKAAREERARQDEERARRHREDQEAANLRAAEKTRRMQIKASENTLVVTAALRVAVRALQHETSDGARAALAAIAALDPGLVSAKFAAPRETV